MATRRRRLPRAIERELAKFLGTMGFGPYADALWNLAAEAPAPVPVALKSACLRQILDQTRHDPGVIAQGATALQRLPMERRTLSGSRGVSASKLFKDRSDRPDAALIVPRLEASTASTTTRLLQALARSGATSFLVVVTDQTEAEHKPISPLDEALEIRVVFWRACFNGEEKMAPRHLALFLHAEGASTIVSQRSRLGLEMMGFYGCALKGARRLYAVLDQAADAPLANVHHLRLAAPHATILALSERDAGPLRANAVGLGGPGIVVLDDHADAVPQFGPNFEDRRSASDRSATSFILSRADSERAGDLPFGTIEIGAPDITVTILFHRERELAVPALASLHDMIEAARGEGLRVEARAMLDTPDDATRRILAERGGFLDDICEVALGAPSRARNMAIGLARGRFLAFLDGDDLWGPDWLRLAHRAAGSAPNTVWHPELYLSFWASDCDRGPTATPMSAFHEHVPADAADFDARDLLIENLWTANAFAARTIYERFRYRDDDWARQIGIEDWRWNLETLGAGIVHKIVPDTVHLIRVKESGSFGQTHEAKALLPLLD